ncbi:thiolase family protein [Maribius pontilimi]|uniref:Thiolase family protein n=1 Tax=Palleronia pontilimi TaxID=1964209 RepID=A0A934MHU2_9RHOB|nr:thiolase family protein [Palleronia pontilimi]MBJ3763624.1 thiolase family protein [Palleronia pontilimi]
MSDTAILAAFRTPVAPRGGALAGLDIHALAAPVIRACLRHADVAPHEIDELILGNALGAGGNPARVAALAAGLHERVAGLTIDRQCVSGLDAVLLGDALIRAGRARLVLAGGAESYSRRPLRARGTAAAPRFYDRPAFAPPGMPDPDLAEAAAALARADGITRDAMAAYAVASHASARAADLTAELVAVAGLARDSFTRALSSATAARAPLLCDPITTATAAVAADGAALLLLGPAHMAPDAPRIVGGCTLGGDPATPPLAPLAAIQDTLSRAGVTPADLTAVEMMEAYASQAMATVARCGIDPASVNRGGGALARGHPIGASGAVNAVRLVHELGRGPGLGLAAIAAAGGLGTALLLRA